MPVETIEIYCIISRVPHRTKWDMITTHIILQVITAACYESKQFACWNTSHKHRRNAHTKMGHNYISRTLRRSLNNTLVRACAIIYSTLEYQCETSSLANAYMCRSLGQEQHVCGSWPHPSKAITTSNKLASHLLMPRPGMMNRIFDNHDVADCWPELVA